jgi:hypothetical protein
MTANTMLSPGAPYAARLDVDGRGRQLIRRPGELIGRFTARKRSNQPTLRL